LKKISAIKRALLLTFPTWTCPQQLCIHIKRW